MRAKETKETKSEMTVKLSSGFKKGAKYAHLAPLAKKLAKSIEALKEEFATEFNTEPINVSIRPKPRRCRLYGCAHYEKSNMFLYVFEGMKLEKAIDTVAHELQHFEQFKTGSLVLKGPRHYWHGEYVVNPKGRSKSSYERYLALPWEVDAREAGAKFTTKYAAKIAAMGEFPKPSEVVAKVAKPKRVTSTKVKSSFKRFITNVLTSCTRTMEEGATKQVVVSAKNEKLVATTLEYGKSSLAHELKRYGKEFNEESVKWVLSLFEFEVTLAKSSHSWKRFEVKEEEASLWKKLLTSYAFKTEVELVA